MQAGGIRRYQDGRNCGKMLTIIGSKVAHCRYSWTSLWEKLAFYVRNKRLTRHHCGRTLLITRWEASRFCASIICTAFKRPSYSLGDYYTGVCGFSESATAFIPYVPSLLRPSLQSLTELEVLCDERYEPVSVSNRLLDIALKGCIHLRHLDLFELPPEECRELCDIMAGLPDKLQLQTLGFRVRRSYSYEEDFVLVGPPFHISTTRRACYSNAVRYCDIYSCIPVISRMFLTTNYRKRCCVIVHSSLRLRKLYWLSYRMGQTNEIQGHVPSNALQIDQWIFTEITISTRQYAGFETR